MKSPLLLVPLLSLAAAASTDCDRQIAYPATISPVCGSDGATYANQCALDQAACNCGRQGKPPLTKLFDGACDMTPNPFCGLRCAATYTPVCGSDGSTYSNACMVSSARCSNILLTVAYDGECKPPKPPIAGKATPKPKATPAPKPVVPKPAPQPTTRKCNDVCPMIVNEVCGSNGVTYSNACLLGVAACKKPALGLKRAYDGACVKATPCATVRCTQFTECKVDAASGRAYCANVCAPNRCAADEVCSLRDVQCIASPCPPIATCTKIKIV